MGNYVYKYVKDNNIIYVGKSDSNLIARLRQHGKDGDNIPRCGWDDINNADIYYVKLANNIMSDVFESEMIRRYKPKYNVAKKASDWIGLPFAEPEWIKLDIDINSLDSLDDDLDYEFNDSKLYKKRCANMAKHFSDCWDRYIVLRLLIEYGEHCLVNDNLLCMNISDFFFRHDFPLNSSISVEPKYVDKTIISSSLRKHVRLFEDVWERYNSQNGQYEQICTMTFPKYQFAKSFDEAKSYYQIVLNEVTARLLHWLKEIEDKYSILFNQIDTNFARKYDMYKRWVDKPLPVIDQQYWEDNKQFASEHIHIL